MASFFESASISGVLSPVATRVSHALTDVLIVSGGRSRAESRARRCASDRTVP